MRDQVDDLVGKIPDIILEDLFKMKDKVKDLFIKIHHEYESIKDIENQKEFASLAKTKTWPGMMFSSRKLKSNLKEIILSDLDENKNIKKAHIDNILLLTGYSVID